MVSLVCFKYYQRIY